MYNYILINFWVVLVAFSLKDLLLFLVLALTGFRWLGKENESFFTQTWSCDVYVVCHIFISNLENPLFISRDSSPTSLSGYVWLLPLPHCVFESLRDFFPLIFPTLSIVFQQIPQLSPVIASVLSELLLS